MKVGKKEKKTPDKKGFAFDVLVLSNCFSSVTIGGIRPNWSPGTLTPAKANNYTLQEEEEIHIDTHREEGRVKRQTEIEVMHPRNANCHQSPGTRRDTWNKFSLRASRKNPPGRPGYATVSSNPRHDIALHMHAKLTGSSVQLHFQSKIWDEGATSYLKLLPSQ